MNIFKCLLSLFLLLILCSCSFGKTSDTDTNTSDAETQITYRDDLSALSLAEAVDPDGVKYAALSTVDDMYVQYMLKLSPDILGDYCIRLESTGTSLDEFGIIKADDTSSTRDLIEDYLSKRRSDWTGLYLAEEYPKLRDAEVRVIGSYVIYAILDNDSKNDLFSAIDTALQK